MSAEKLGHGTKEQPYPTGEVNIAAYSEMTEEVAASEMSPSRIFILRPIATSLLMIAVLLAGFVGYTLLPQSALPEVDYPTIQVTTLYPGASPDVTTSSITSPLERQFGQMPGLTQMWSSSSGGASVINLRFDLKLPLDVAEQEVQAAINAANSFLPTDLPSPPIYAKVNPADAPVLTLGLTSESLPLTQLEDLADTRLAQKLSQVTGVGLVTLSGGQRPSVQVQVNAPLLASQGLSLANIQSAIVAGNVNTPKGSFDGPLRSLTINANDQLESASDYQNLIVAYHSGAPVRLADVATVQRGAENELLAAWVNHKPGIVINVQRQPGANVIAVVDQIQKLLPRLRQSLPGSTNLTVLSDRTVTIRSAITDVKFELMLSIVLVVLVIFIFLRNARATFIPAMAVPLSLIGTFGAMYIAGFSINNLTLMALTIATGFVVDDAIVMIENIARYIEMGEPPLQAALKGAKQIGFTIISLTFSLIAVLIPLLFMGDVVGRLFREFAITLAVAILISAIVSLSFTPMLSARLLNHVREDQQSRLMRWSQRKFDALINGYGNALRFVLRHQKKTLWVTFGTLALTVLLYILIPKGFFPVEDTGLIRAITVAPQSISFQEMNVRQHALVDTILKDPAVQSVSSFIGVDGTNTTLNNGRILISLKPLDERGERVGIVMRHLQQQAAQVSGIDMYMQPVQDLTIDDLVTRSPYQFSITAVNGDDLAKWTNAMLDKLRSLPQFTGLTSSLQNDGLQAYVEIDRDAASRLGISVAAIDNALYSAFAQRLISTIFTQAAQYRVVLQLEPEDRQGLDGFNSIYLPSGSGPSVPLSQVAHIVQKSGSLEVDHLGQFPATMISYDLAPGVSIGEAVQAIHEVQSQLNMPAEVQLKMQGASAAFEAALSNQLWLLLAAVATMYIVLGVLYESFVHPVTILSTLPSAGIGALLALLVSGNSLTVIAIIGIILLIGIVQKNAIMMVDFALDAQRNQGLPPADAILQAAQLRLRPILMTTFAALFGAVPLIVGGGMGAELRQPLGITLVGGLLLSQLLTLFTTPVIYLAFDRIATYWKERFTSDAATKGNVV